VLALPPGHPLAKFEEVELAKIRNERLLFLREGHCFRESALAACRKARAAGNAVFESDQFASILALVAAGSGIRPIA
jgi:LysR family transcriptional regulator, hydrogen peroxide-inducible genes activator